MSQIIGAIFFAVFFPLLAAGQASQDSWDSLKQLQVGQKIEVVDMSLRSVKGSFTGVSDAAISIHTGGTEVSLERAKVLRVSARGGKRGRNALIGLAIGAAAGAAIGAAQGRKTLSLSKGQEVALDILICGGIGAGVGAAFPGSRTIYRAEKPKSKPGP